MKNLKSYSLMILAVVGLTSCNSVPNLKPGKPESVSMSSERLIRIDRMIQEAVDNNRIAGATAFIARDGKIVFDKAFGVSDLQAKTPMRTDNIFRIASQTKAIVSIAAMTLFEEGKFLLDDPVSKYIPEFGNPQILATYNEKDTTYTTVPAVRQITVRHLLTHTSGIEYAGIGSQVMRAIYAKAGIAPGFGSNTDFIGSEMRDLGSLPLVHQPGERFTYGLNVDVVGYLIEIWSGMPLDRFLRERIFEPLGMNDTYFYLPAEKHDRLVKVSGQDADGHAVYRENTYFDYPLFADGTYFSGGAGLSSTTKDYAIFLQMLLNNGEYNGKRILARRTVELITTNQIGALNRNKNKFGLGFEIVTEEGQKVLGLSEGSFLWGGYFATDYWADPKEKIVGLIFIQQSPMSHNDIHLKFMAMVYQALDD